MSRRLASRDRRFGGIGPSGLPPIGGMAVFLRSDLGIVLDGSNNVQTWLDQSGHGVNPTQGTSAARPAYNTSDANYGGKPSLSATGTQGLQVAFSAVTDPKTVYCVCRLTTTATQVMFASSPQLLMFATWSLSDTSIVSSASTTISTSGFACVYNGASSALYQNSSASNLISGNPGTVSFSALSILSGPSLASPCTGSIAELLVYGAAHSAAQVSATFKYFAARYGTSWS